MVFVKCKKKKNMQERTWIITPIEASTRDVTRRGVFVGLDEEMTRVAVHCGGEAGSLTLRLWIPASHTHTYTHTPLKHKYM